MTKDRYSYYVEYNACLGSADSISDRRWPQSEPANNNSCLIFSSVGDPDPDHHVFGPPGSRPLVRGTDSAPDPDPSLSHKGVERTEIMLAK
jgi:hypothetical protein